MAERKTPVVYRKSVVEAFCSLISESDKSTKAILADHPGQFPTHANLIKWRDKYPFFARRWKLAQEQQAEYLMQSCLDLARNADKTNAHAVRVKFDIYKFIASKRFTEIYGDKPATQNLSVQTNIVVSPDRLNAIRGNLDRARAHLKDVTDKKEKRTLRTSTLPQSLIDFDKRNGHTPDYHPKKHSNISEHPAQGNTNSTASDQPTSGLPDSIEVNS